jgi:hypothetical protein
MKPEDLMEMLMWDKDVIAAPCPKKQLSWDNVRYVLQRNPKITNDALEGVAGSLCFNLLGEAGTVIPIDFSVPNPVRDAGTGVLIIKRHVLEKFRDAHPELRYNPTPEEDQGIGKMMTGFFMIGIDQETRDFLSEDYWFCREWRKMGGEVHICPWIKTTHTGMFTFRANLVDLAEQMGSPTEAEAHSESMGVLGIKVSDG